jgi:hypothetical protein
MTEMTCGYNTNKAAGSNTTANRTVVHDQWRPARRFARTTPSTPSATVSKPNAASTHAKSCREPPGASGASPFVSATRPARMSPVSSAMPAPLVITA